MKCFVSPGSFYSKSRHHCYQIFLSHRRTVKLILTCLTFLAPPALATTPWIINPQQAKQHIQALYHELNASPETSMQKRIARISAQFIGKPYQLGALGEGKDDIYDQAPLYRTDAFDCETYVDTVLALALGSNVNSFEQCIRNIRYLNGQVSFITRNHFTCLDWNKNNQKQGYLKDITPLIVNKNHHPVARWATALIDKPNWYRHFSEDHIRIRQATPTLVKARLLQLKEKSHALPKIHSTIPYLPLSALFDKNGHVNTSILNQIPQATIIEIIRPHWDVRQKIGTQLNVSHMGIGIWKDNVLMFRQASLLKGQVIDIPLVDYLLEARKSPTIKGINLQIVVPKQPLSTQCKIKT